MKIELKKICDYAPSVDTEREYYYFDKKTYDIIKAEDAKTLYNENYIRCIPLFRIDYSKIDFDYLKQLNNKKMERGFELFIQKNPNSCLFAYLECFGNIHDYYEFCDAQKKELAIAWCKKNNIKYIDTSKE